ncbi:hypothetical protein BGW36DRAFT_286838 [Talaromyces proteolyticus]|uniref:Uncharacterized protein n=1 Tax=Talaromyces proteolyticus TaxID=1131652 RepID=A0AAD4L0S4_9EURO|nr:uncharacterized protein BGW36DRAFT_286838 [Talaromyces proteolyticus]KAH8704123.1 hypothetical protein BGW36DRAFT_286838 [Talaromyces proteolyticus]
MSTTLNPNPSQKKVSNPRRLLILTPTTESSRTIPPLLTALTGVDVNESSLPQIATNDSQHTTIELEPQLAEPTTRISFAGYTTHAPLHIETKYYTADIPIWVDEIPVQTEPEDDVVAPAAGTESATATATANQWKADFLSDEAQIVRDAIGALMICVRNPVGVSSAVPKEAYDTTNPETRSEEDKDGEREREDVRVIKNIVQIISDVKSKTEEERDGGMGEVPGLLVLMGDKSAREEKRTREEEEEGDEVQRVEKFGAVWWEDVLYEMGVLGMEVIIWDPTTGLAETTARDKKRNQFGELEGLPRVKEVLSALEWEDTSHGDGLGFLDDDDESGGLDGFGLEVGQLEREMMGLRFAINNPNEDDDDIGEGDREGDTEVQVEELEGLMLRMKAIKDMSVDLPEAQRKAFAAKAVRDIMREL